MTLAIQLIWETNIFWWRWTTSTNRRKHTPCPIRKRLRLLTYWCCPIYIITAEISSWCYSKSCADYWASVKRERHLCIRSRTEWWKDNVKVYVEGSAWWPVAGWKIGMKSAPKLEVPTRRITMSKHSSVQWSRAISCQFYGVLFDQQPALVFSKEMCLCSERLFSALLCRQGFKDVSGYSYRF